MDTKEQAVDPPQATPKQKLLSFFCKSNKCWVVFSKIVYIFFVVCTLLASVAVMVFTVGCSAISRNYSISESSRAAYMILVAVTAGITVSTLGYSILAICKSTSKPMHIVGALLFACTIMHITIALTCVKFTKTDEDNLYSTMEETLSLAKRGWPDEYRLWAVTQSDLSCCGYHGPDDYLRKLQFPPNVPISCCPAYDSDQSDKSQEGLRAICKKERLYHKTGCKYVLSDLYYRSGIFITISLYVLAAFEFVMGVLSIIAALKKHDEKLKESRDENQKDNDKS